MPLSRRRKRKNGKKVGNGRRFEEAPADIRAGVTLQDLINVVAAQEYAEKAKQVDNEQQTELDNEEQKQKEND